MRLEDKETKKPTADKIPNKRKEPIYTFLLAEHYLSSLSQNIAIILTEITSQMILKDVLEQNVVQL